MRYCILQRERAHLLGVFFLLAASSVAAQEIAQNDQIRMLGRCSGCSVEGEDLSGQGLTGIDFSNAVIRNVDFSNAALSLAIFDYATLENVKFDSADLNGVSFRRARMKNVSFINTELKASVFEDAVLEDTDLLKGLICNTQMPNETMNNSDCDR